ncbi:MAG: NAD-dependent epimerase/dehydratase family protein [Chitinophagales bacterium]|nr:NAD-dependent epimerase/dehydratase family protein [Chitinophagales bacterium]
MVLVTGAQRCIGENLIRRLVADGLKVRVFHPKEFDISSLSLVGENIDFFEGELLDVTDVYNAIEGTSAVFHCDILQDWELASYESRMKYNIEGTANVVNAMLYHGVSQLTFFSTLSALGAISGKDADEQTKVEKNEWTTEYALSVVLAEREVWRGSVEGLKVNVLNCGDVLSYHCNSAHHLFKDSLEAIKKNSAEIYPSFIYYVAIDDVIEAAIQSFQAEEWNKRYLVFGGKAERVDFYEQIAQYYSLSISTKKVNSVRIFLKLTKDFLNSIFHQQGRMFRRVNVRYLMQYFYFDNTWTTQQLNIVWTDLNEFLNKGKQMK